MAFGILAGPGVDVLAEQGDLARAGFDKPLRFAHQFGERPRDFGAARIGHDAIGAELVAPFLHREEGARRALAARGEGGELGVGGHVGIGRAFALRGAGDQFRQAVIGLGAHDHADSRGTRHDLLALGLRDAAGDRDHRRVLAAGLHQAADIRIDLFGRLFANVAGVEHDEVGLLAFGRRGNAFGGKQLGHALAVVDVHLAAEALDPEGPGSVAFTHGGAP